MVYIILMNFLSSKEKFEDMKGISRKSKEDRLTQDTITLCHYVLLYLYECLCYL